MRRISQGLAISVVLIVLTLCATWLMRSCARTPVEAAQPAVELAKRIVDGISRRLQFRPEVRVDRVTVMQGETPILELATVRREFAHEYEWEHQWLGSTKRLHLRGTFAAKAGFDLGKNFYLEVDSDDLSVDFGFPDPRVLGVEMIAYRAEEEEGYWNKLSAEEREQAVNALLSSAREAAAKDASLTAEARRMFEAQIGESVREAGGKWQPKD